MNQILHPLPCHRLQERAFWAQGVAFTLEKCGKTLRDLPSELRSHCSPEDLSLMQISQTDMNRLWDAAAKATGDDCFGLQMGQQYTSNTLKILSLAAISSITVGDALQRVLRYMPIFSTQVQLYSVEDEQYFTIYFEPRGPAHPFQLEAVMAQCDKLWRSLDVGPSPLVVETRLTGEHDKSRELCEAILSGRVRLGAKRMAVRMNRQMLKTPCRPLMPFCASGWMHRWRTC
jgi:hypothetical protein